ncbi:hypothetical protein L3X38_019981 [Prunus dulcis]|uniref:Pollen Ole e 1 allergen and extensin family protein n=1 Tax=Prunus dulcis TaxID=3755 RepID=A0AAD4WE48_PRUDU|nr:hypothetical protein L3X38_019981 [Prunus dulcis]
MSWFFTVLFLISALSLSTPSEASHEKKTPSAVVVGTVYCDTCFQAEFSHASHFISGASVGVECKDGSSKPSFQTEVKTDSHGVFRVQLPFSVSKHVKKIEGCSVKLISSSEPYCAVASTATSSSLHLKSRKQGTHIFSAGFFTFKPLKQPSLCNQKPSIQNSKEFSSQKFSFPPTDELTFPPPTQNPTIPDLPSLPTLPYLPPLPLLPPLPPLPGLPGIPGIPVLPPIPGKTTEAGQLTQNSTIPDLSPLPTVPFLPPLPQLPPLPPLPGIPGIPVLPPIPGKTTEAGQLTQNSTIPDLSPLPTVPFLPPLPQLPPLPPLPGLPGIPGIPVLPPIPGKTTEAGQLTDKKVAHPDTFFPANPFQPPSILPPNPLVPQPTPLIPNPFQPPPAPLIPNLPPIPGFTPPAGPTPLIPNLPPIPGFTPSPSPPPPSFPFLPPLPFPLPPIPRIPGIPPAFSSSSKQTTSP